MRSRVAQLAVLVAVVVAVPPAAADQRSTSLPPPGIRSNPAWRTVTTGPTTPAQHAPPLGASGALSWATTSGEAGRPYTFKHAAWPPRLNDFRIDDGWEGQPLVRIQQRLLALAVRGWNFDVRGYFGTHRPSRRLLASVLPLFSGRASEVSAQDLGPHGVGAIRFGTTKLKTVTELSHLFGPPSARGINTACGPRYTEVEWADLVAEFRSGRFSGFRFIEGGYPLTTAGSPREASPSKRALPKLAVSAGVSVGSTVAELRAAYSGRLQRVGAEMWRASDGLIFVDDAKRDPVPATSRIVEIKIGTCGAF